jgi:hypothetical protein
MKELELKMDRRRYKNQNLTLTDCIDWYNQKIESVSEDRSIEPFAHLWSSTIYGVKIMKIRAIKNLTL